MRSEAETPTSTPATHRKLQFEGVEDRRSPAFSGYRFFSEILPLTLERSVLKVIFVKRSGGRRVLPTSVSAAIRQDEDNMSMLVLYATGHPRLYRTDEEEVVANMGVPRGGGLGTFDPEDPAQHWWPSTTDFLTEARRHARRPVGVGNFEAFRRAIEHQHDLETVLFFGHAGNNLLKFGDTDYIRGGDLRGHNYDLSTHFAPNGHIILYACNAAHTPEFLAALADSLRVTVCGFRGGVRWTLRWTGESPHRRITWRGISRNSDSDPLPNNYVCASPNLAGTGATGPHSLLQPGLMRFEGPLRGPIRIPGPIGVG